MTSYAHKRAMRYIFDDHLFNHDTLSQLDVNFPIIQSFVLTRFNLPLDGARERGGFQEEETFREWCRNRCRIFNKICLPSLLKQTVRPTAWILLFDGNYLEETAEALDAIKQYEWIVPVILFEKVNSLRKVYTENINARLNNDTDIVITTRLDNDDALAYVYCEATRQYVMAASVSKTVAPYWISYPYGVQWDSNVPTLLIQNNNPFLSLVESADQYRKNAAITAMSFNHGRVYSHGDVKTPTPRFPMWLQYVHSENVSNKKNPNLFEFGNAQAVLSFFGLTLE